MGPGHGSGPGQGPGGFDGGGTGPDAFKQRTLEPRVGRRIRVPEVRVIADDGAQLGVMSTQEALRMAEDQGLDLVEVSPMAKPPVCKIMDYGKFKYQQKRKANDAKKKQTIVELKEVKFRPKTDVHDFQVKLERLRKFLGEGNKGKVTIMFRGREIVHAEIGHEMMKRIVEAIKDEAVVESAPRMEGRQLVMIVAPGRATVKKKEG
jgi:translation initiation factor IF-3